MTVALFMLRRVQEDTDGLASSGEFIYDAPTLLLERVFI
jgi:hypothetical protein